MARPLPGSGPGRALPRNLHPVAWWLWALGLAAAASRTTNPVLLALVLGVAAFVVVARRGEAPWARAFRWYLLLGLVVVGVRVGFRVLFGVPTGTDVLFALPRVPLPQWAAGIELGGPVYLESVLGAAYDGLRLATLLCCVGAANALANPKRALRVLPGALYEIGVAAVVAVSVAPQVVTSAQRVVRARRLRGRSGRHGRGLRGIAVPVLQDALARSLALAAAMDSRGYGRTAGAPARVRRLTAALVVLGLLGLCLGVFALLGSGRGATQLALVAAGAALCCAGLVAGGRRVRRSSYRADPWRLPEWVTAVSGLLAAAALVLAGRYAAAGLQAPLDGWPQLGWLPLAGILVAALPAFAAPPPPRALPDPYPSAAVAREAVG